MQKSGYINLVFSAIFLLNAETKAENPDLIPAGSEGSISYEIISGGKVTTGIKTNVDDFELVESLLDNKTYQRIKLSHSSRSDVGETAEEGLPSVPVISIFLAIPDEADPEIVAQYTDVEIIEGIELEPVQPPISESGTEEINFTINRNFYDSDLFYPGDLAEAGRPKILRDVRFSRISVYPFQYNPARKILKVYHNLSVSVSYKTGSAENPKTFRREYFSNAFMPLYRSLLSNYEQFCASQEVRRGGYLIIAKNLIADSLQTLAAWKRQKGYDVYIASATEINPNGNPSQLDIRTYIQNAYENWEIPPEYVLLVGDEDNLSTLGLPDYPYSYYTSDHPYSMVDGDDYLPDVFVGRLSVDNITQLRIAVAKILAYDRNPQMEDLNAWRRGLSVGGNIGAFTPRLTVLWVRQLLLRNGFTQVDTSFKWTSGQPDPYLLGYFNEGPSIVSYRGWAGSSGWYSPLFNTSSLDQIQNHNKLAIIASVVCGTGNFGADECFGEKWIRMGASTVNYKGGPAFLGSTDGSGHTRWHNPIMVGYYWGLFNGEIYHFAVAGVNGKINLYKTFPRHTEPGSIVEKYFHTFNFLGDPEVGIRTAVPAQLTVTGPSSIPLGMNYVEIEVDRDDDTPVEGAYVTLIREAGGVEEFFGAGTTDETGMAFIPVDLQTTGAMLLTVSGRNINPYQGEISIVEEDLAVGFDSLTVDDDNGGYSSGNGNGVANPYEVVEVNLRLKNFGTVQTADNVIAIIEPLDVTTATVYVDTKPFGDIGPGETGISDSPYVIRVSPSAQDGRPVRFRIAASDDNNNSWETFFEIPVEAPRLMVGEILFSGGNNRLDPGETELMEMTIVNGGSAGAEGIYGVLTTTDDYISIISSTGYFGDIPAGDSGSNSLSPFLIGADSAAFDGRNVNLSLRITSENGYESEVPFAITVGEVQTSDPLGPDEYEYYMYDNTDLAYEQHPVYSWVELAPSLGGNGTRITFEGYDDDSQLLNLPFDFVYYGQTYSDIIVSIDGFISPDTTRYDMDGNFWSMFFNWSIPDPGNARGQISPFWDDLSYSGSNYGVFHYYDQPNHRYIIEWYHMTHRNTNAIETFELIIADPAFHSTLTGDSEILFQYFDIWNNDDNENYASVGIENFEETTGLEYSFDGFYAGAASNLIDGRAVKITTNTGRGGVKGSVTLQNGGGDNSGALVSAMAGQYRITEESGVYFIRNVPPGASEITAEKAGYFPLSRDVSVMENRSIDSVDFELTRCPVPLDFYASEGLGDRVVLYWSPVDHQDLTGYNIFRSRWENGEYDILNTNPVFDTIFTDYTLPDNGVYWYYVTAYFEEGGRVAESFPSEKDPGSLTEPTGTGDEPVAIPDRFFLNQNYPNPFNQGTIISYGIPNESKVTIEIFDILGRKTATVVDRIQKAGFYKETWNSSGLSSGIYFYRIQAADYSQTRKMLILK